MAMEDGCKLAAGPKTAPSPQRTTKSSSSRLRALLQHAACLVPAAAHLARAAREPRDVAFVVATHGALAMLLLCLGRHEAAPTAAARGRIRAVVWALSTALMGLFACRVAPAMPPPLGVLVYGMALVASAGGFALLFLCHDAGDGVGSLGNVSEQRGLF